MLLSLDTMQTALLARAEVLGPVLFLAFFIGEPIARFTGIDWLFYRVELLAGALLRKLDRPHRSAGTRLYRGMIATGFLLIPTLVLGFLLSWPADWAEIVRDILLIGLFGRAFETFFLRRVWKQSHEEKLPLVLPNIPFLFHDSHAVLRYLVLTSGELFASGIVGASFWYLLGGIKLMLPYLLLSELAQHFRTPLFGWAARGLFSVIDALPRLLSWVLLILASIFVPRAHLLAARKARSFTGLLSALLGVSLGGHMPQGDLPWIGEGTAKLLPVHLSRWLLLRMVALFLLLLATYSPNLLYMINYLRQ